MSKKYIYNKNKTKRARKRSAVGRINCQNLWNIFLACLLVAGALTYLWLANNRAVSGYKIAKMERNLNELKAVKESLEARLAQLQKSGRIADAAQKMQLVKVQKVEYLVSANGELAQR